MAQSPSASLSVHELTKRYGAVEAVREVSFEIAPGEIFGLLGPNGAGKTSIIETILGLRRPDSGSIIVNGIDALEHPAQARRWVGAQLQFASLQDKITPRQALKCFAAFYENAASVDELLGQFSLGEKANAAFDSLSGGQKQRLFLALALINQPRLLVLDEPTAGLDPKARRGLHALIRQFKAGGRAVLVSTHYLDEAHELCDRVGILHEGCLVAVGTPNELIARSRTRPRLIFRTAKPLESTVVGELPAVIGQQPKDNGWMVQTSDVNRTISGLVRTLEHSGNEMLELQIQQQSLEDVFLELTNTAWAESPWAETSGVDLRSL